MSNMFAQEPENTPMQQAGYQQAAEAGVHRLAKINYSQSPSGAADHIFAFLTGFVLGFLILFVYYKIILLSIVGGGVFGVIYIFIAGQNAIKKRKYRLRTQFFDMLESLSVSMRAGNPPAVALRSARSDLLLLYPENSDIIMEVDVILALFENSIPLSQSLSDFAQRSGLEDIESFASIYRTIEGKASRADEIVRQTQSIISDKIEIEMEIETLMTASKSQMKVMLLMPIVILLIMGYMGAGFMDAIYTTAGGRLAATAALIIYAVSVAVGDKTSTIKL